MILCFELTMPNRNSWNGKWSGDDRKYYRHRKVTRSKGTELLDGKSSKSFYYNFGDGWGANVEVTIVDSYTKRKQENISKGFWGYDWMIDEILDHGKILTLEERRGKREHDVRSIRVEPVEE